MNVVKVINVVLILALILLLRKLIWCLRWLWCYYHGLELPQEISILPQQSGNVFDRHIRRDEDEEE